MSGKKKAYYELVLESECLKISVDCKGCKKEFWSTTIEKHLGHKPSCKGAYQQEELDSMKEKAKLRKWANIKSWLSKNDQTQKNAKRYRNRKTSQSSREYLQNPETEELSEYEKIRLANIEENKIILLQLKSKSNA